MYFFVNLSPKLNYMYLNDNLTFNIFNINYIFT